MRTGTTSPNSNGASDADDFLFTPPAPPTPTYNPSANGYSPAFASSNAPYTAFPNSPFSPNTPGYPASPYSPNPTSPVSPVMSTMPMQPMPASVMSPDEMLRAYAERKKAAAAGGVIGGKPEISYPMPIATNGARPLFGATGTVSPNNTGNGASGHQTTGSVGVGSYGGAMYAIGDGEDAYGGTTR
ncbi:hypothetical protein BDQ12DRAFT_452231 [Crucibulum laeve]|uniref:Uncharacterized protein n=1 Tax=Crucibulum laeve TaxID=68775 RepID=A0A5C3LK42_9AGAR|nr:hypothetical protein BDQ12DRAFT_452231 [Crucibulum laeve]